MSVNRSFPPYVYFLRRADGEGPVKIGCSQRPEDRLSSFFGWSPYPLEIAATLPGDETVERGFHALFRAQHSHREWFHPSPELLAVIERIKGGTFDVTSLPPPRALGGRAAGNGWTENSRRSVVWAHRLRHLEGRGVEVPADVAFAARRWHAGPWHPHYDPHRPEDAALVEAFLEKHPPRSRRKVA